MNLERKGKFSYEISSGPDYGFLTVTIPPGQTLKVEASAMATMDTHVSMKTKLRGGLGRFLTGESLFVNEFKAEGGAGQISIAPGPLGEIRHVYLDNQTVFLQNSAFVAADPSLKLESKWQGLMKGFFSGESLFLIRASGQGDLWFNSFGAILEIDVTNDYVVDTSFIVGFTEGLDYQVRPLGGLKSFFLSGEGFVCHFRGQGKVWVQTRQLPAFIGWVHPFRRVKSNN